MQSRLIVEVWGPTSTIEMHGPAAPRVSGQQLRAALDEVDGDARVGVYKRCTQARELGERVDLTEYALHHGAAEGRRVMLAREHEDGARITRRELPGRDPGDRSWGRVRVRTTTYDRGDLAWEIPIDRSLGEPLLELVEALEEESYAEHVARYFYQAADRAIASSIGASPSPGPHFVMHIDGATCTRCGTKIAKPTYRRVTHASGWTEAVMDCPTCDAASSVAGTL